MKVLVGYAGRRTGQQLLYRAFDAPKKGSNEKRTRRSDESSVLWIWKELDLLTGSLQLKKIAHSICARLLAIFPSFLWKWNGTNRYSNALFLNFARLASKKTCENVMRFA